MISPSINPNVSIKEEPSLSEDWFQTEESPPKPSLNVKGVVIEGETWTCFDPKSSEALASWTKKLEMKLELLNTRLAILYERYYHKEHPQFKLKK